MFQNQWQVAFNISSVCDIHTDTAINSILLKEKGTR